MTLVLDKALTLVDLVASGYGSLDELTKAAKLSRSTAHRLLTSLVRHSYLDSQGGQYVLGYRLLELGEQKKRSLDRRQLLLPILRKYASLTEDTIHIALLDGVDIVLIERVPGSRQLQLDSFLGQRTPAFSAAVGKVLIGQLPEVCWKEFLVNVPRAYPKSVTSLRGEFKRARELNIGIDKDECDVGTCGIAASFDYSPGQKAAVSINGATVYFPDRRLSSLEPIVLQLAAELQDAIAPGTTAPRRITRR